ncbi:hypothetical protein SAMN04488028_1202 [Reichenbachiella agariperforans]|uniref:Uncharacterized protein n=1 Tax=Reichenbachiella agariperforans TaxID=156994 RepID=A0A1M6WZ98_REIAG|nr:hypothetical protein [Reichenbachiella agariperforans]SHK98993.1 hypothetical protein SAMN04488028_1202 [Reichenbachiella agariperforans]
MKKRILIILIIAFCGEVLRAQNISPQNLKDSLLTKYSWNEIKEMSSLERTNVIRAMRGEELLPEHVPQEEREYDFFGIKVIKDIPKDSMKLVIDNRIDLIKKEKDTYRQEIFPNAIVDVTEGWTGNRFYKSYIERTFSEYGYRQEVDEIEEGEVSAFSNFSKRVYFFNEAGSLRLITREMGYNINEGQQFDWSDRLQYKYKYEETYVWDDSIIYKHVLKGTQYGVSNGPFYIEPISFDTTKVKGEEMAVYFYKDNSFGFTKKNGSFHKSIWKERMLELPFIDQGKSENGDVISFRNRLLEYEEFESKQNDYLSPVPTSFLEPYVIDLKKH